MLMHGSSHVSGNVITAISINKPRDMTAKECKDISGVAECTTCKRASISYVPIWKWMKSGVWMCIHNNNNTKYMCYCVTHMHIVLDFALLRGLVEGLIIVGLACYKSTSISVTPDVSYRTKGHLSYHHGI